MRFLLFALAIFPFITGFGAQHSSLESSSQVSGDDVTLQFKIGPKDGMILTHQAPWSITFTDIQNLDLPEKEGKYVSKEYDEKLPGFTVKAKIKGTASQGAVKYKMKAFVCTKDKTRCYPQTHKGTLTWKKS